MRALATVGVSLAWGALAGAPVLAAGRRGRVRDRARALLGPRARRRRITRARYRMRDVRMPTIVAKLARLGAEPLRRHRRARSDGRARRDLPLVVELVAVAVGAGCTPYAAVELAASWSDGSPQVALRALVDRTRVGASFDDALRATATEHAVVRPLLTTLRRSAELGTPASDALARLAAEVRAEVRREAEARARTVPVRMLFPLVLCVLPAFALLTVAPVLLDTIAG